MTRDTDQQQINFSVWDTGIGIARQDLKRLFQPFVQLNGGLSRAYEGTGLGLALVYRLVELLGGSISVESGIGKGSRFTVSLPWKEVSNPTPFQQEEPKRVLRSMSASLHHSGSANSHAALVLIVEDHEATLHTLSEYLSVKAYRVLTARTGPEALEQAQKHCPDLVLMDIQLPEMDGLDVIRHLRADERCQAIPIIAVTALVMPGDRERCLDAGADEYLRKPVRLQELLKLVEHCLKRSYLKDHENHNG